jgi:hypothetical protein
VRLSDSYSVIDMLDERPVFPEHWLLDLMARTNLPLEQGGENRNNITIISGDPGSGKSETGFCLEQELDPGFVQAIRDQTPHFSHKIKDFIRAILFLPEYSYWHIDEPPDIRNVDWWTTAAQALHDCIDMMRYRHINLMICGPVLRRMNPYLVDICRFWIQQRKPGFAIVKEFRPVNIKHPPWEQKKPFTIGYIRNFGVRPCEEILEWYVPIKDKNFVGNITGWIDTFELEEKLERAKQKQFQKKISKLGIV